MPLYSVRLFGTGIAYKHPAVERRCISFHVFRASAGADVNEAVTRAQNDVLKDWTLRAYARDNSGDTPKLKTEGVSQIGLWQWLRLLWSGSYVFYPDNPYESDKRESDA